MNNIPGGLPPHAEIYVGHGLFAICDWSDWDIIKGYRWALTNKDRRGLFYAQAWSYQPDGSRKKVSMHRLIIGATDGEIFDHKNGNGLDNRKENLRKTSTQQNSFNQSKRKSASSCFKGVSWDKESCLWRAYIKVDGKRKYLGRFSDEIDAAKAYDQAAKENFNEFARPNF